MTTAALSAPNPVQIEAANFLNLLIVDDERAIREICREVAQSLGFNTAVADSAEHAYRLLDTQSIDVVLLDLKLPGAGGLEALHQIGERKPDAVIVVVTGYGTVQSAVQAMKNGAYDYVTKPFSMEELKLLLERVSGHLKLKTENRTLREKIKSKLGFGSIVGRAPEMEKLYRIIGKAAHSNHPVLILGESGTGKEMVARSIHFSGPFRDKPFIPVDCGSLVPTLIESELFGYVKGAFTGAVQSRDGLLAIAEGGTVFLDEVGELAGRSSGQAAAGHPGAGDSSGGKHEAHRHQRANSGGHQSRSGAGRGPGNLSPRSLFPAQCAEPEDSSAARPAPGHSVADRVLSGAAVSGRRDTSAP